MYMPYYMPTTNVYRNIHTRYVIILVYQQTTDTYIEKLGHTKAQKVMYTTTFHLFSTRMSKM